MLQAVMTSHQRRLRSRVIFVSVMSLCLVVYVILAIWQQTSQLSLLAASSSVHKLNQALPNNERSTNNKNHKGSWQCQDITYYANDKAANASTNTKLAAAFVSYELCVYSALYDDRQFGSKSTSEPVVRVFVLISALSRKTVAEDFLCKFWSHDPLASNQSLRLTDDVIAEAVPAHMTFLGRGHNINVTRRENARSPHYAQRMLSCPMTSSGITSYLPSHLSVISKRFASKTIANVLPIFYPESAVNANNFTHEFGVCVPIAFGTLDVANLVQWIEIHRHLGVSEFNIYNASLSSNVDRAFKFYSNIIRVHQLVPPVADRTYTGVKIGSAAGINDCVLRYRNRYRYIVIVDFDEVIVPRADVNYSTFMSDIVRSTQSKNNQPQRAAYNFKNIYFFKTFPTFTGHAPIFTYFKYRYRLIGQKAAFGKAILDPRLCFAAFNHGCFSNTTSRLEQLNKGYVTFADGVLGEDVALVHHYRNCRLKLPEQCLYSSNTTVRDDVMLRYANVLLARFDHVFGALGISYKYRIING